MIGPGGNFLVLCKLGTRFCKGVFKLTRECEVEEANEIQKRLVYSGFIVMDKGIAALKAGLNLIGYRDTVPRRATRTLSAHEIAELKKTFKEAGIL